LALRYSPWWPSSSLLLSTFRRCSGDANRALDLIDARD
jgi:hypothetical protein